MRGSQKHLLDFIDSPNWPRRINETFADLGLFIDPIEDVWIPTGIENPKEAQLVDFLKPIDNALSVKIRSWWLVSKKKANTPNWDLISTCKINGVNGLLLIEAKAHKNELSIDGKKLKKNSNNSIANHNRITEAINEARLALVKQYNSIDISVDSCYQLSNRIAYSWWLAKHKIPVILLYVGFLNAEDVKDLGEPFRTNDDWNLCFNDYTKIVGVDCIINKKTDCDNSYFWLKSLSIDTKNKNI
jgi:hypothetical protein